jgi:hypothetical protein
MKSLLYDMISYTYQCSGPSRAGEQIPLLAELSMTCQAKQLIPHARFANEYHGTKQNRIWKHDRVIVAQDLKATAYYVPRRCRQCQEIIIYDEREIPHCPECGKIYGDPPPKRSDPQRLARFKMLKAAKASRVIFKA